MIREHKNNRIVLVILGLVSIFIGLWAFFNPIKTVVSMTWLFGLLVLAAGIFEFITWNNLRKLDVKSFPILINAILSVVLSLLLIFTNMYSLIMLGVIFAIIFIVDSISWFEMASFSSHPKLSKTFSFIGIILGVILLFSPMYSLTVLLYTFVYMLIAYGIMTIIKAF